MSENINKNKSEMAKQCLQHTWKKRYDFLKDWYNIS